MYLVYTGGYFWLLMLSVQVQFGFIRCISNFLISRKLVVVEQNVSKISILGGTSFVHTEYLSLLSAQGQFGVIWCICSFLMTLYLLVT